MTRMLRPICALLLCATSAAAQPMGGHPGGGPPGGGPGGFPGGGAPGIPMFRRPLPGPPPPAEYPGPPPAHVTSDTLEDCMHLAGEVANIRRARPTGDREINMLADEGQAMCVQGFLIMGIKRLRRAHALLMGQRWDVR